MVPGWVEKIPTSDTYNACTRWYLRGKTREEYGRGVIGRIWQTPDEARSYLAADALESQTRAVGSMLEHEAVCTTPGCTWQDCVFASAEAFEVENEEAERSRKKTWMCIGPYVM